MSSEFWLRTPGVHTSPPCPGIGEFLFWKAEYGVIFGFSLNGEDCFVSDVARLQF